MAQVGQLLESSDGTVKCLERLQVVEICLEMLHLIVESQPPVNRNSGRVLSPLPTAQRILSHKDCLYRLSTAILADSERCATLAMSILAKVASHNPAVSTPLAKSGAIFFALMFEGKRSVGSSGWWWWFWRLYTGGGRDWR
jgi:hypothetical protein